MTNTPRAAAVCRNCQQPIYFNRESRYWHHDAHGEIWCKWRAEPVPGSAIPPGELVEAGAGLADRELAARRLDQLLDTRLRVYLRQLIPVGEPSPNYQRISQTLIGDTTLEHFLLMRRFAGDEMIELANGVFIEVRTDYSWTRPSAEPVDVEDQDDAS